MNFLKIVDKYSKMRFNENPSSGSEDGPCIHTERMKLIVTFFCNFVISAYKNLRKSEPTVIRLVTSGTGSYFICSSGRLADSLTWILLSFIYQKQWFNRQTHQIIMLQETFIILDDHMLVCVYLPGSNLNIQAKAIVRYNWHF